MGLTEFLNTPIGWVEGLLFICFIGVIAFIIMKKRAEEAKRQAKIEQEVQEKMQNEQNGQN